MLLQTILMVLFTVIEFGFLLPYLISAPNTLYVIIGCASTLVWGYVAGWYYKANKYTIVGFLRRWHILSGLFITIFGLSACVTVPAGNVGIKVNLLGSDKGVDDEQKSVGRYMRGMNESWFIFPTFTQNYVWTKNPTEGSENDESITFQTKKGMSASADVGISYHIKAYSVFKVFQKYRKGVDEITDIFLRNMVRG